MGTLTLDLFNWHLAELRTIFEWTFKRTRVYYDAHVLHIFGVISFVKLQKDTRAAVKR